MFEDNLIKEASLIANQLDVETAVLLAVIEVESAGRLSAKVDGKQEPLIRFEGHYFYRLLPKIKRNRAIANGLAHPNAGRIRNPMTQSGRWKLLRRAVAVDRTAAFSSVSWGLGQVMGSHWRWLGYASIDALVSEARNGVAGQVRLMAKYIKKAGLIPKLQSHDWAGFARAYNGPAYRKYKYHTKMAAAYRTHCLNQKGQVFFDPNKSRNQMFLLRYGSRGAVVKKLQNDLRRCGYQLEADGDFGPATKKYLKLFQLEQGLDVDGICGPKTFLTLERALKVV